MMRRLVLLLLCMLLLTGCAPRDPLTPMVSTATDVTVPAPVDAGALPRESAATLWFRFSGMPLLAPEERTLSLSLTAPYELALLQALTAGPTAASIELSGLFPPGVRVLATHRQGRTLFVTLSRQIMNDYADEAAITAEEAVLRRQLAMQAIAATVTENCDVDAVVILVEHTDPGSDSLRLRQSYYREGSDASALAQPLSRDEDVLLTPGNTLALALDSWQRRDWASLYPILARNDAATGSARPAYEDFVAQMAALPHLTAYSASAGNISPNGQSAVFAVTLTYLDSGQPMPVTGVIRLHRERGIWRISLSQLSGREVAMP